MSTTPEDEIVFLQPNDSIGIFVEPDVRRVLKIKHHGGARAVGSISKCAECLPRTRAISLALDTNIKHDT